MEVAVLGFAAGCIATWLFWSWRERVRTSLERSVNGTVATILEAVLLGLDNGQDMRQTLRDLLAEFGASS